MRYTLYMFRCSHRMTQQEIADKIGVDRMTYSAIENGKRDGSMRFWNALKKAFNLEDAELMELMKVEQK